MSALHALLTNIVDYAGLFPPAKLELEPAITNYARYRDEPGAFMLGRFIIPAARLAALDPHAERLFDESRPLPLSVLAGGAGERAGIISTLQRDLALIEAFRQRHGQRVAIEALELRVPKELTSEDDVLAHLDECFALTRKMLRANPAPFFEQQPLEGEDDAAWNARLERLCCALALHNLKRREAGSAEAAGLKLRCGGVVPTAFPSIGVVAHALDASRRANVPFKATAGLHHPLRHYRAEQETDMHGFLNVFLGGALARHHQMDAERLTEILELRDAEQFQIDENGARIGDLAIDADALRDARAHAVTSFGSCSFDEPREDLATMAWL